MPERRIVAHETTGIRSSFGHGLHHIQLAIPPGAEDTCRAFYLDVLGMTEVTKPPPLRARGGLWVRADGVEIHLGVEPDFRPARKAHPGILVSDVESFAEHLTRCGVPVEWGDTFPGFQRFHTYDCVGNRLEFMTPRLLAPEPPTRSSGPATVTRAAPTWAPVEPAPGDLVHPGCLAPHPSPSV